MSNLDEDASSDGSPVESSTQQSNPDPPDIENNTVGANTEGDCQPPAAVEVATPTKTLPEQSGMVPTSETPQAISPTTPKTPKTPMTQEGTRYRALFGELKKRYKEQQGVMLQLKKEKDEDEKEKKSLRELVAAFKSQNENILQRCSEMKKQQENGVKLTGRLSEEDFKTKSKSKKQKQRKKK